MLPSTTIASAKAIWTANPALSAAAVQRRLGTRISIATLEKLRPQPPVPRAAMDPEPTRAVLRARAAELGFVAFDGPSLPYGAMKAIARASRKRKCAISYNCLRYAWAHGLRDLAGWPLTVPFIGGGPAEPVENILAAIAPDPAP